MRHRFKRRTSAVSNLTHTLCEGLGLRKFGPTSEKEHTAALSAFSFIVLLFLLADNIFAKLSINVTKNQRNRGHSSKFNFAHTLSIGKPKSHTYDKDVRLLKFSLVSEKST